ncbi:MAG TPA: sigma-70 family RNA polymerase sigma factor [Candidatus Limnocylindrales bacterium]
MEPESRDLALQQSALLARARQGDVDAFTGLVESRLEAMVRTATAILGDPAEARDATQEALVAVWRDLPALRDPERFDAWAGAILVNACRHTLRRRARVRVREIALATEPADEVPGLDASFFGGRTVEEEAVAANMLERAFERLSGEERALLVMHHLDERPLTQIAAWLGIPVGTAKSRLHAARQKLARGLERESR